MNSLQQNESVLPNLSEKVASLNSDFGGLRDHVHIEYPSQSDRSTGLGREFTKLNAKFGTALDSAVGPLRHIETLIPKFNDYDRKLEAVESLLSKTISEWSDVCQENAGNYELDRQLPECKAWRSLLKSSDDLEDNITMNCTSSGSTITPRPNNPTPNFKTTATLGLSPLSAQSSVQAPAMRGRTAKHYTSPKLTVAFSMRSISSKS